ncbi:MAG TPA: heavy metal-binding domain-containing protein [Puia sp.]
MKKYIFLFACIALLSIVLYACSNNTAGKTDTATKSDSSVAMKDSSTMKQTAAVYTCKMHPEVISDKPGKCPKCGMDLVKKETVAKDSTMQGMKMDSSMKGMKMDSTKH